MECAGHTERAAALQPGRAVRTLSVRQLLQPRRTPSARRSDPEQSVMKAGGASKQGPAELSDRASNRLVVNKFLLCRNRQEGEPCCTTVQL